MSAHDWKNFLISQPELLVEQNAPQEYAAHANSNETAHEPHQQAALPEFPEAAWRGQFAEYRAAMAQSTEAADAFHFAALWTRCAVALGRRVHFSYGMQLFPNVYLVCFGPTGDRKTTATRTAAEIGSPFKIVRGGGSGEGLADEFSGAEPGEGLLLYASTNTKSISGSYSQLVLAGLPNQRFSRRVRQSAVLLHRSSQTCYTAPPLSTVGRNLECC